MFHIVLHKIGQSNNAVIIYKSPCSSLAFFLTFFLLHILTLCLALKDIAL